MQGESWEATLLSNNHVYDIKLQSLNQLIRGGFSSAVSARPVAPGPAPIPPTSRSTSVTTGWGFDTPNTLTQLYDITGAITANRAGSTMQISSVWDSNGKHLGDASFIYQLWDCTYASDSAPLGLIAWERRYDYPDNPTITNAYGTNTVTIDPTHYYMARVTGSGHYDWKGIISASFSPYAPQSLVPLIPFDTKTSCF